MYRKCDRALQAMSPMFLGGLTARAMKLQFEMKKIGVTFFEVYPGGLVRSQNALKEVYNKKDKYSIDLCQTKISSFYNIKVDTKINNYHQIDSLLALVISLKYIADKATSVGDIAEGLIWI